MKNIQLLLDSTFPTIDELLKSYGEFYPIASALTVGGEIAQISTYDGDDRPESNQLIIDLKSAIRTRGEFYSAVTIFYDVWVTETDTEPGTNAIAVYAETRKEDTAFIFYYPYILTPARELKFSESWKIKTRKEVLLGDSD